MITGFVRVLASSPGVLLLLLAIATAPTTLLLQPVGASTVTYAGPTSGVFTGTTTSTTTPTDDLLATDDTITSASSPTTTGDATDTCSLDVNEACENDATCASCMWLDSSRTTTTDEFEECPDYLVEVETTSDGCPAWVRVFCCMDFQSEFECMENDQFVDFWRCFLDNQGCPDQEVVCPEEGGGTTTEEASNGAVATTAASLGHGTAVIAFAFCCALALFAGAPVGV